MLGVSLHGGPQGPLCEAVNLGSIRDPKTLEMPEMWEDICKEVVLARNGTRTGEEKQQSTMLKRVRAPKSALTSDMEMTNLKFAQMVFGLWSSIFSLCLL
jgi:hypothetical protein